MHADPVLCSLKLHCRSDLSSCCTRATAQELDLTANRLRELEPQILALSGESPPPFPFPSGRKPRPVLRCRPAPSPVVRRTASLHVSSTLAWRTTGLRSLSLRQNLLTDAAPISSLRCAPVLRELVLHDNQLTEVQPCN